MCLGTLFSYFPVHSDFGTQSSLQNFFFFGLLRIGFDGFLSCVCVYINIQMFHLHCKLKETFQSFIYFLTIVSQNKNDHDERCTGPT